jgi:hypothetical protein
MENPEAGWLAYKAIVADVRSFDMTHWGRETACGTKFCLAGHVLLAAGYSLARTDKFVHPSGAVVDNVGREAEDVLGLSLEELTGLSREELNRGAIQCWLWDPEQGRFEALQRFKRLLEAS